MPSQTVENYLKALYKLSDQDQGVSISALSKYLGVSKPSVSAMVKNLHQRGLVNYERYRPLSLTQSGHKSAALVLRKHRLTEMYLVQKMGFGWDEVHDIAEQIEHIDSIKFFERMDELLGHPTADPHGSPIPNANGEFLRKEYKSLTETSAGKKYTLKAVSHNDDGFLSYLTRKNIALGTKFKILEKEPFDGSIVVEYGKNKRQETLSKNVCDSLLVE